MSESSGLEGRLWNVRWPLIGCAVVVALVVIQAIRVNQPGAPLNDAAPIVRYANRGPLLTGKVTIGADEFHSMRFDLNRRAKLSGSFHTPTYKQSVTVLVLDELNFENWKAHLVYRALATTGAVPAGKVSPMLEPGTYYLVISNRGNANSQSVETEFNLE